MILYFFTKFLPLLVLPLGLSLLVLLGRLVWNWRWAVPFAFSALWFFSLGVVSNGLMFLVEAPWERRQIASAQKTDAIVVLSSSRHPAPGRAMIMEWNDPDRFFAGIGLFKAGKAPRLFFTGGASPFNPLIPLEGQLYIKQASSFGIPEKSMATTTVVFNTAQEAKKIKELLDVSIRSRKKKILLVTSAFHMQRAKTLFERMGIEVAPFPVDFKSRGSWAGSSWRDPMLWLPSSGYLGISSVAIREMMGRIVYRTW